MTQARKRITLWVLVGLFFGPLLVSYGWYFLLDGARLEPSAQYGELIHPARPLPQVELAEGDFADSADLFTGRWSIVYFAPGECAEPCRKRLYELRQLRLTLGRHAERVQRVWFYSGAAPNAQWLGEEHPGLITISLDQAQLSPVLAEFPNDAGPLDEAGEVYLVDPLGNLMMRYPPDAGLRGIRDDLDRLLRLSRIG